MCLATGCNSISGLFMQCMSLLAPMESADPRLIPPKSFLPLSPFRLGGSRSDLFTITPCRTLRNPSARSQKLSSLCLTLPRDFFKTFTRARGSCSRSCPHSGGPAGDGWGGLRLTPDGGPALESGLSMAMAAAGTRGELVDGDAGGVGWRSRPMCCGSARRSTA